MRDQSRPLRHVRLYPSGSYRPAPHECHVKTNAEWYKVYREDGLCIPEGDAHLQLWRLVPMATAKCTPFHERGPAYCDAQQLLYGPVRPHNKNDKRTDGIGFSFYFCMLDKALSK